MNNPVFVDTSAWFAGIAKNDQFNEQAIKYRNQLLKSNSPIITSNLIIHETTMLLERKASKKEAIRFLKVIISDPRVEIIHVDEDFEMEAYSLYQNYKDQDFSVTDSTSFVIMRRRQISRCFTFDHHFSTMGFTVEPH
jgi:predicted nucleic acid-binding protein